MRSCPICHGAIGEPGVAYGYAGKWCVCERRSEAECRAEARRLHERQAERDSAAKQVFAQQQQSVQPTLADVLTLTPEQFVMWLRGYYAAATTVDGPVLVQLNRVALK
jgi:hypothetical protein